MNATSLIPTACRLLSIIALMVGTAFLLLLNGQHFTNRVVFISCVACSSIAWRVLTDTATGETARRHAALIAALHLVIGAATAAGLGRAYDDQQRFNARAAGPIFSTLAP